MNEGKSYRVQVIVRVNDERALVDYADARTYACWDESVHNLGGAAIPLVQTALAEALINSNENPSPDEYGIEILECSVDEIGGG